MNVDRTHRITTPDGTVLQGETAGAGTPLVLVPGAGGDHSTWNVLWPRLTELAWCVRYDLRGHDAQEDSEHAAAEFRHANDLEALLDGLGIRRIVLAGVSMGGRIAVDFALDHPGRVDALILISPGLADWDWSSEWRQRWHRLTTLARDGCLDEVRECWYQHPLFATTRRIPALAADLRAEIADDNCMIWLEPDHEAPPRQSHVERLHELTMPTMLITGTEDVDDFRLIADVLAALVPDIYRIDLPATGHLAHRERPAETISAMATFLAGIT